MSEPAAFEYEASGGQSELRTYGEGEGLTIERQDGAIVVAWSAEANAEAFLEQAGALVPSKARVQLAPAPYGRLRIPFWAARAAVQLGLREFRFIAVDFPGGSFTWEAPGSAEDSDGYPSLVGEVGIATASLHREWVARLVAATATPRIRADVSEIVSRAEDIVSHESVAAE
jgi:hypothetical protein